MLGAPALGFAYLIPQYELFRKQLTQQIHFAPTYLAIALQQAFNGDCEYVQILPSFCFV